MMLTENEMLENNMLNYTPDEFDAAWGDPIEEYTELDLYEE